ncbi:MAG: lipocalin family protein [Candidatus Margulisiibacteriota bacterium]
MARILIAVIILTGLLLGGCLGDSFTANLPDQKIDPERYLGTWYEIARIPNWFEKDLTGVTATYSPKPDDKIEVLNQGYLKTLDGEHKRAVGEAWIPNKDRPGQLKVSFFWPFSADYIVLAIDEEHTFALVGSGRDYLWILSRTPVMDEALYNKLILRAKELGYDTSRLEKVEQK